jgi:hypothetical protein
MEANTFLEAHTVIYPIVKQLEWRRMEWRR